MKLLRARKPLGYGDLLDLFQVCESASFEIIVIKFGHKIYLINRQCYSVKGVMPIKGLR